MMMTIIARVRAWLRHPAARRALEKRRLERVCRDAGTSRSKAAEIAARYFGGEARE